MGTSGRSAELKCCSHVIFLSGKTKGCVSFGGEESVGIEMDCRHRLRAVEWIIEGCVLCGEFR